MYSIPQPHSLVLSLRLVLTHGIITVLALVIAFALPQAATYILYRWWPMVENDANLLLATEIALASALVLLFNALKLIWDGTQHVGMTQLAALVHAREGHAGWLERWRERLLVNRLPAARDAYILTLTGYDTLVDAGSALRGLLEKVYEIRIMLLNPTGEGLRRRVVSMPEQITQLSFHSEIEASLACLSELRKQGKKVTVKFYDDEPFWRLIVLGDYVWVQHCHTGHPVREQPEYVFALRHDRPRHGLFVPFYMHFLNCWHDVRHPEYDFETGELIHRDGAGNEVRRSPIGIPIDGMPGPSPNPAAVRQPGR